jgi:hypothetical protein
MANKVHVTRFRFPLVLCVAFAGLTAFGCARGGEAPLLGGGGGVDREGPGRARGAQGRVCGANPSRDRP